MIQDIKPYARLTDVDWDIIVSEAYGLYVEVGTHKGGSACAASINADKVITADIYDWPKAYEIFKDKYKCFDKIKFIKGTSIDLAMELSAKQVIDCLFIDGAHEYEYVMMDCKALVPLVKPGGTVLFHDHNPNNPITRVYEAINDYLKDVKHQVFPKITGSSNMLTIKVLG